MFKKIALYLGATLIMGVVTQLWLGYLLAVAVTIIAGKSAAGI